MAFVALGALATFAIFAATTITNVPEPGTIINGDAGIFPGTAFTGFPPGEVTGTMYSTGSYAGTVKGDAQVAYNDAAGQASTSTLSNTDLQGLTLSPGVYKFDAAAALSAGQLFLDANGDSEAVWIFQIGSSLNIAAGTEMLFTSGVGNANNVVWQVGTSVTLNGGCAVIGNFMSNEVIAVKAKATVQGRLVSLNGAVTLIDNTVTFPDMTPTAKPSGEPTGEPSAAPTISAAPSISAAPTSPSSAPSAPLSPLPTASPTADLEVNSNKGGDNDSVAFGGMVVGIIVGGVVLIAAVAAVVVYKVKNPSADAAPVPDDDDDDL